MGEQRLANLWFTTPFFVDLDFAQKTLVQAALVRICWNLSTYRPFSLVNPVDLNETERGHRRLEATVNPNSTGMASSRSDYSSSKEAANDAVSRGKEAVAGAASSL